MSLRQFILVLMGLIALVVGIIGIFLPLLPTTPFLLLAAACFARSSERLHQWLVNHPWFGSYIKNYQEHQAISLRVKIIALILIWGNMGYTAFKITMTEQLRILLLIVAVGVTLHMLRMKTLPKQ